MTSIGEKIKELRKNQGMSQSALAGDLGVTSQAVSKWESNASSPDIALLPTIAAYFGIAIDDLFEYSRDKEMERIQNMIWNERYLSNEEFLGAERFLLKENESHPKDEKTLQLLADLYDFEAKILREKAMNTAKQVLEINPESKNAHSVVFLNGGGPLEDWNISNHDELIAYYYDFVAKNPKYPSGYLYLFDLLLEDARYDEAEEVIKKRTVAVDDCMNEYMHIQIVEKKEGFEKALPLLLAHAEKYADDWRATWDMGNDCARNGHYELARKYIQMSFETEKKPRYSDALECIALASLKLGDKDAARKAYEDELVLLRDEWNITFGETVDEVKRKLEAI